MKSVSGSITIETGHELHKLLMDAFHSGKPLTATFDGKKEMLRIENVVTFPNDSEKKAYSTFTLNGEILE